MANNITIPVQGAGDITPLVATDNISVGGILASAHVQYMKLVDGRVSGTATIAGTSANGLLVDVSRVQGSVTAAGTITATLPFLSGFLISGMSATGTAQGMDSRPYSIGYLQANFSGNSASASLLASYDSATWMTITSYYTGQLTANSWFTAQLNSYYPFLAGRTDFVSANGGVTVTVWMHVTRA